MHHNASMILLYFVGVCSIGSRGKGIECILELGSGCSGTCGLHVQQGRNEDALQSQRLSMFVVLEQATRLLGRPDWKNSCPKLRHKAKISKMQRYAGTVWYSLGVWRCLSDSSIHRVQKTLSCRPLIATQLSYFEPVALPGLAPKGTSRGRPYLEKK